MHILISEDDTPCRIVLRELLVRLGHTVVETTNGQELVDTFIKNQDQFDAIFTDIMMPNKNGLEAVREIKKIKNIPCVAITAFDTSSRVYDYSGNYIPWSVCNFYIRKPIDKWGLQNICEKILER